MAEKARKFAVGQRVWMFDLNSRSYTKGDRRLIYEKHFQPCSVAGIEGRSYLIQRGYPAEPDRKTYWQKVGFAKAETAYVDDHGKDDLIWINDHRHKIREMVNRSDAATLRMVAEVIGYNPDSTTRTP